MAQEDIPLDEKIKRRLEDNKCSVEDVESTIFRVPANIRKANRNLYEPHMVSIGPYYHHHRTGRLQAMEDHKWRLLKSFLCRNRELPVDALLKAVLSIETEARQSYSENIHLNQDDFIQMLLLDSCFILELFLKWHSDDADVLFKEGWGSTTIFCDLLLFENQIPFFVIERLYEIVMTGDSENKWDEYLHLLPIFLMEKEPWSRTFHFIRPKKVDHLLDLYHEFLITQKATTNRDPPALSPWKRLIHWKTPQLSLEGAKRPQRRHMPCAIDLQKVGVKFRKKQWSKDIFDVKFHRGILEIPRLQINRNKKALLSNLLALEKHKSTPRDQTITDYVRLMDSLINTAEDVALLQHAGVIHNMLSSHQEAAIFFNQLGDSTSFYSTNHHYGELFIQVQQYYDPNWNRRWARLMRDYFNSPWSVISVIAAMILLSLSAFQTFYTVYPYYVNH